MTEIKRLDKSHLDGFCHVNDTILKNLTNPEWYIPIPKDALPHVLDGDSTLVIYGAFVDGVLAGVSLIDLNKNEFSDLCGVIGVTAESCGELGACMVLPEYRGKNLMYLINCELLKTARDMGLTHLVASAHPDNIASNTSLKKLGFDCRDTITRCGHYLRNAYFMEV